ALVGLVETDEDLHQRGLAGAILADEGVHLALAHVEIDVVIGHNRAKAFSDALKLDLKCICHGLSMPYARTPTCVRPIIARRSHAGMGATRRQEPSPLSPAHGAGPMGRR